MKILVGMPSKDSWGGPIASEPPFVAALRETGAQAREEIYVYGDKEKPTPFFERVRRVLSTAFRFRQVLKHETFDLIHLNTALDLKTLLRDSVSIFLMKPENTKIFLKIHGSEGRFLESGNFLVSFLRNYLNKKVDGIGVHTLEEKSNFLRGGFSEEKFFFVKNAVTITEILPPDFPRPQKEKTETFDLLFVSRFIAAKGLIETIRACKILHERGFKFILNCIGDGEIRSEAEREVERLNLQSQVKFTGYIPETEVTKYFFSSDIFVFPTRHAEGFPNVLFKAVAVGMPIVTTKIRAAADYLNEPENCLFSSQAPENIAEKIIKLIESQELRKTMSVNNLKFGETLKPINIAREFLEIYLKITKLD
ncbi:MAG: glycosyltransferase family 4 protein [Pyrinomonadaceae bacterium]